MIGFSSHKRVAQSGGRDSKRPNQLLDHPAAELGELFVSPGVVVGEAVVIEAEEVEDGAVDVADVVDAIDGFGSDLVGGSDGVAGFRAATCEPHRHRFGIMIAAVADSASHSVVRRAAKFATPDDQRVIKHAALFKVF